MKKTLFTLVLIFQFTLSFSQNCSGVNTRIDSDYSYVNDLEGISIPFNQNWKVLIENEKSILVFLQENSEQAVAGIVKNKNGYFINSAHDIDQNLVIQLVEKMTGSLDDRVLKNVKLKNIPAKEITYNYKVYNLGDTYNMSGIIYMIVNDGYTYVFMFNCNRTFKDCYIPFFKNVIKNTYFNQDWY